MNFSYLCNVNVYIREKQRETTHFCTLFEQVFEFLK